MDNILAQTAIDFSLNCQWIEAIKANKEILKENKSDVDALNRLARAYFELGKIKDAKSTSLKALKFESSNKITIKALEKYKLYKSDFNTVNKSINNEQNANPKDFLEEPGKTKLTHLINLGPSKILNNLDCGDEIILSVHSHRVNVTTVDGDYIGRLPDDLSARLRVLVKGGNKYKIFVKSSDNCNIKIFIKEIQRGKDYKTQISFPPDKSEPVGELSSQSDF